MIDPVFIAAAATASIIFLLPHPVHAMIATPHTFTNVLDSIQAD